MGDYFQAIVDRDATAEEAEPLAMHVRDWLITEGIVSSELTDCILSNKPGHPPGPDYTKAAAEAPSYFRSLAVNGLEIILGRNVFWTTFGCELVCRGCGRQFEAPSPEWRDAVDEWYKCLGPGMLACPHCGYREPVTEWKHEPDWGFGNLGFKFWNWPPLTPSFIEQMTRRLGHRTVLVSSKI